MVLKSVEPKNVICDRKTADLPPQMTHLNAVISILMHLFIFSVEKVYYLHKATSAVSCQMPANEKPHYVMTSDFRQYIAEYTVANF